MSKLFKNIPEINQRVVKVRKALNFNQKEMAESLGLQQSYYSGVENGRRNVTGRIVEGLKVNHGVSADYLYSGKGDPFITISESKSTSQNVPILTNLEKKAIQYDENGWPFYDAKDLTDDEIILNSTDPTMQLYLKNYSPERAAKIDKAIDKQRDKVEVALNSLIVDEPIFLQLRRDIKAIRNFDYLYKEVAESQILRQLTGIDTIARYTIKTKDIEGIKQTLITDLQRFKSFIEAVIKLAAAFREFSNEILTLNESERGISDDSIDDYIQLSV